MVLSERGREGGSNFDVNYATLTTTRVFLYKICGLNNFKLNLYQKKI